MNSRAITYLPRTGLDRGLVKGVSRAQRGRSRAMHAKTLDEPESSRTIGNVMARACTWRSPIGYSSVAGGEAREDASLAPVHTKPDTLRVVFRYVVG
jgi:hypothetical protein